MNRRNFLGLLGLAAAVPAVGAPRNATPEPESPEPEPLEAARPGVLRGAYTYKYTLMGYAMNDAKKDEWVWVRCNPL